MSILLFIAGFIFGQALPYLILALLKTRGWITQPCAHCKLPIPYNPKHAQRLKLHHVDDGSDEVGFLHPHCREAFLAGKPVTEPTEQDLKNVADTLDRLRIKQVPNG